MELLEGEEFENLDNIEFDHVKGKIEILWMGTGV